MTPADQVRADAVAAADQRLKLAFSFIELNARAPLFEKTMRLRGGRKVKVGLYLPGPVLLQFDPQTNEIFARSKFGQIDQLDPSFLDE